MAVPVKEIGLTTAKAVGSFREAVQDLLVPELRALKVSMEAIRTEMQLRDEKQMKALEDQGQRLTQAVESLAREMKLRDERQSQGILALSEKLDFAIDIRERLAVVEARLPRQ